MFKILNAAASEVYPSYCDMDWIEMSSLILTGPHRMNERVQTKPSNRPMSTELQIRNWKEICNQPHDLIWSAKVTSRVQRTSSSYEAMKIKFRFFQAEREFSLWTEYFGCSITEVYLRDVSLATPNFRRRTEDVQRIRRPSFSWTTWVHVKL